MTQTISPGRWRGLKTTSTDAGIFNIMAFDQRGTYHKMLPTGTSHERAAQIKRDIVVRLAPEVSAVLLDAEYGLQAAFDLPGRVGLLMALEKSGYSGDSTYRQADFVEGWTVEKIKMVGASAVKLLVYYHPETGPLAEQIEGVVRRVSQDCQRFDIPLFVEPISYSLDASIPRESPEFARTRPQVAVETARRLGKLGMDILKLEFPVDAKIDGDERSWRTACEAMSAACPVPWVLLSAGVDFDVFERQVQIACQCGASGFLGGRAIWKEAVAMEPAERERFVAQTASSRLRRLSEITAKAAHPWTDFYRPIAATQDWYLQAYPERV